MDKRARDVSSLEGRGKRWVEDSESDTCMGCSQEFSIISRRHHCRVCGNLFCGDCVSMAAFPEILHHYEKVLVCKTCISRGGVDAEDEEGVQTTYTIVGYQDCPRHKRVSYLLAELVTKHPKIMRGEIVSAETEKDFLEWVENRTKKIGVEHTESPICFLGTEYEGEYLGGEEAFIAYLRKKFPNDACWVNEKRVGGGGGGQDDGFKCAIQ
mmetsp:Transcript_35139/g.99080  ORF Transcript_35139/g.99080 Transcript_35139/m.99080 type:complete len:211 (-) Transcript_35139:17-649(-)